MKYTRYLLIWFLLLAGLCMQAQKPNKPSMYLVTVDIETGNDMIYWTASLTPPDFDWYVIIEPFTDPSDPTSMPATRVGQVTSQFTEFTNTNPKSSLHSVGYAVFAEQDIDGLPNAGLWSAIDSTIFLTVVFDTCEATISLAWNDYNNWQGEIYNIYRRIGPLDYQLLATVGENTNTYVLENIEINTIYDLFVRAIHQDGRESNSNLEDTPTLMSQQPDFINADYATIGPGNSIDLSFTIGGSTGSSQFDILRSSSVTGPFNSIASINTSDSPITYNDDDVNFLTGIYYYRIDLINNCGTASVQSNLANNIILSGTFDSQFAILSWNGYLDWLGGIESYSLIRSSGVQNPQTETIFAGNQTNFTDDISGLIDQSDPASSMICYHIVATESPNIHGIRGRSESNRVCFSPTPDVRIPNAFIPNDTDPVNQVFEPVFSFVPEQYDLVIYNRLGVSIWQGSGPWDGRVNGNYVPEGVYLYYLRVYNYSTDKMEYSGSITVVYR